MKKLKLSTIKVRVKKGVEYMNEQYGRYWLRKIDPERLALQNGTACVIGQVEGEYNEGRERLGLRQETAVELGFDFDHTAQAEYLLLTQEWKKSIIKLQKLFKVKGPDRSDLV